MLNPTSFLVKRSVCVFWGCETVYYLLPPTPPTFLVPRQKTVIIMFRQFDQSWTQSAESRFRCLNSLWGELDRNVIVVTAGKLVGIMMCVCGECRESDANTMWDDISGNVWKIMIVIVKLFYFILIYLGVGGSSWPLCQYVKTSFIYTECIYNNFLVCTA